MDHRPLAAACIIVALLATGCVSTPGASDDVTGASAADAGADNGSTSTRRGSGPSGSNASHAPDPEVAASNATPASPELPVVIGVCTEDVTNTAPTRFPAVIIPDVGPFSLDDHWAAMTCPWIQDSDNGTVDVTAFGYAVVEVAWEPRDGEIVIGGRLEVKADSCRRDYTDWPSGNVCSNIGSTNEHEGYARIDLNATDFHPFARDHIRSELYLDTLVLQRVSLAFRVSLFPNATSVPDEYSALG